MHYREVDWLPDYIAYPQLVAAFHALGLETVGFMILDSGEDGIGEVAAEFDGDTAQALVFDDQRPMPVLVTPGCTTVVEVSAFLDEPSVRLRTLLRNGALVETLSRWSRVPDWPRALRRARRYVRLEPEMTRAGTIPGGRSVEVAHGLPDQLLEAHRDHVARLSAHYGAEPVVLESMDDVMWMWNKAFWHADRVEARAFWVLLGVAAAAVAAAVVLLGWTAGLALAGLVALGFFRALVALRYWPRLRPRFARLPR